MAALVLLITLCQGQSPNAAVKKAAAALASNNQDARAKAIAFLVKLGPKALPYLRPVVLGDDGQASKAARVAWKKIAGYEPGVPAWASNPSSLHQDLLLPTSLTHKKTGIKMVLIPAVRRGTRPFYLAAYELTYQQWDACIRSKVSTVPERQCLPNVNVEAKLAEYVSEQLGLRLPTQFEWEHACRGGENGERYGPIDEIAWHVGNSHGNRKRVGLKKPNRYGLYDMLGSSWEWCRKGKGFVACGGGYRNGEGLLQASSWFQMQPGYKGKEVGFRVAKDP